MGHIINRIFFEKVIEKSICLIVLQKMSS